MWEGKQVIVRTCYAGVHIGELMAQDDKVCVLTGARRLWRWKGSNTLNEVSTKGVDRNEYSRISEPVDQILLQWIEILPIVEGVDLRPVWNEN